jgi:hypothetical protein
MRNYNFLNRPLPYCILLSLLSFSDGSSFACLGKIGSEQALAKYPIPTGAIADEEMQKLSSGNTQLREATSETRCYQVSSFTISLILSHLKESY